VSVERGEDHRAIFFLDVPALTVTALTYQDGENELLVPRRGGRRMIETDGHFPLFWVAIQLV